MRKPWDQHWMEEALHAAEMSTCASGRRVGAVFVKNNRLLSTGFNGVPSKYPHPDRCARRDRGVPSGQGLDLCPCNHAEMNGIVNAARHGVALEGAILYCTTRPCVLCMGPLVTAGVVEIVFAEDYPHPLATEVAKYADVTLRKHKM